MEYRKMGTTYYARIDRGEEIIASLLEICRRESIRSAIFTGIGGCSEAEIQTFIPEEGAFETERIKGMLELVNLTGNIIADGEDGLYSHTHATFACKQGQEHRVAAGHVKSATVLYTAEIELRPVCGGVIRKIYNAETGTGFWSLRE